MMQPDIVRIAENLYQRNGINTGVRRSTEGWLITNRFLNEVWKTWDICRRLVVGLQSATFLSPSNTKQRVQNEPRRLQR